MRDRKRDLLDAAVRTVTRQGVRGLHVEEIARDAGVSTALIYYHFGDRSTPLQNALLHVEQTAERYTSTADTDSGHSLLVATVLAEFQDEPAVRDNSAAW